MSQRPLLKVSGLTKFFSVNAGGFSGGGGLLRAVNEVSFSLNKGRTLGLVGESGCGKSTTGRLILRLIPPTSGIVELDGEDITKAGAARLRRLRRRMQIVFQDPLGSLHPRMTAGYTISEPLLIHGMPAAQRRKRLAELLEQVELPEEAAVRYPHEFSGGQRQRVAIARALALDPDLIIADEPVSALDASIQSQILMLLKQLQEDKGMAYLFISHDLAVIRFICHEVAVMYLGEIVEFGPVEAVYLDPRHPYTQALLSAIPRAEPDPPVVKPLEGSLPSAVAPPDGCAFASRCPHAMPRCYEQAPPAFDTGKDRWSRCWLNESGNGTSE